MNPLHPAVVWLTWRQIFSNRRIWLALLLSLAPLLVTLFFRSFSSDIAKEAHDFYITLQKDIVIGSLLPLAALIFGATAFGGELDDGTLIYLLVKPIPRWRIVISKYTVAVLAGFLLMLPAVFLPWLLLGAPDLPLAIPMAFLWGLALGAVIYGALFMMFGLAIKHPLAIGLLYVVLFDEVLARTVSGTKSISIREFATSTALRMADPALNLGIPALPAETVRNMGLFILAASLIVAVRKLARYEMTEKI
jgi:ABC-2 type transport system permease protein